MVTFVCRGNIGRSQMAKAFYDSLYPSKEPSLACGTRVGDNEGQKIMDIQTESVEEDIEAMLEIGLDISKNTRRQITKEIVDTSDLLIVMAEKDTWPDYLKESSKVIFWEVENPKDAGYEKTKEIRDIIKNLVTKLYD